MFATGDLVCWNEEGELKFFGRKDKQLKLRGYRIDLTEIEDRIMSFKGVDFCRVKLLAIPGGDRFCAYYCSENEVSI